MSLSKIATSTGLMIASAFSAGLFATSANATQMVSDLVPKQWQVVTRSVEIRDKMYSTNLYGDSAQFQVLFENNGTPTSLVIGDLAVNSDSFSCRSPQAGDDLGSMDPTYTQICSFDPKLLLTNGSGTQESPLDYWMRVKMAQSTGRSVILRYQQPIAPQCSDSTTTTTYNPLNTCGVLSSDISFSDNNIHKPHTSYSGSNWAPLAIKGQTYTVKLDVRQGKVEVVNGIKLKVSGAINADPNVEVLEGIEFNPSCSNFESDSTLPVGVYTCTFTVGEDGFIHIPLKRVGSGSRRVITTITNVTSSGL